MMGRWLHLMDKKNASKTNKKDANDGKKVAKVKNEKVQKAKVLAFKRINACH